MYSFHVFAEICIFHLHQQFLPARPLLLVDPWQRSVDHQAGTTTFAIANQYAGNSMTYTVSETSSWISIVSGANGTNAGTVTLNYTANAGLSARTGTVTVTAPGAGSRTTTARTGSSPRSQGSPG